MYLESCMRLMRQCQANENLLNYNLLEYRK